MKKIFFILLLYFFSLNFSLNLILAEETETLFMCGGDEETIFLCTFGDSETGIINKIPLGISNDGRRITIQENITIDEIEIEEEKIFSWILIIILIFILLILIILCILFRKKKSNSNN